MDPHPYGSTPVTDTVSDAVVEVGPPVCEGKRGGARAVGELLVRVLNFHVTCPGPSLYGYFRGPVVGYAESYRTTVSVSLATPSEVFPSSPVYCAVEGTPFLASVPCNTILTSCRGDDAFCQAVQELLICATVRTTECGH